MFKNLLLIVASLFFCFLAGELFFRLFPSKDIQTNNEYAYRKEIGNWKFLTPHHSLGEKYAEELDHRGYYKKHDYTIWFNFNQYGARWLTADEQQLQGKVVLLLGDSYTYGSGIRYEDTYSYLLQESMRENGREFTVLNFGKSGANSETCLQNYNIVKDRAEHHFVLYSLHLNDLISFDTSYILRNQAFGLPGSRRSKFIEFVLKRMNTYVGRQVKIKHLTSPEIFETNYYHENMKAIVALKDQAIAEGKQFRLALLPIFIDLQKDTFRPVYDGIKADLQERNIEFFDLTYGYESYSDASMWIFPVDQHPNEVANAIFAEQLTKEFLNIIPPGETVEIKNSAFVPASN